MAISWCISRLILHPLRNIAHELNAIPPQEVVGHQLVLPRLHQDDEIGMLVRSYNLNQQLLQRHYEEQNENAMRFPVSDLPNEALLMGMLEQVVTRKQTTALMIITCEPLRDTAGVLKEAQREILLLTLVEKLKSVLSPRIILAQISGYDFAAIANGVREPWQAGRVPVRCNVAGLYPWWHWLLERENPHTLHNAVHLRGAALRFTG